MRLHTRRGALFQPVTIVLSACGRRISVVPEPFTHYLAKVTSEDASSRRRQVMGSVWTEGLVRIDDPFHEDAPLSVDKGEHRYP